MRCRAKESYDEIIAKLFYKLIKQRIIGKSMFSKTGRNIQENRKTIFLSIYIIIAL